MMLTILGSGTVVPDGNRNSAGYFITAPGVRLMMDCGAGTVHALARYHAEWEEMTHVFISHFHVDHAGEIASLFFAFKYGMRNPRSEPLMIIAPEGIDRVMEGLKTAFGENLFEPKFPVILRMVSPGERIELAQECFISVAKTPHTQESLAARVESQGRAICYTGDTDASSELAAFFDSADLLVSECSFRERREGVPHLSIRDVAEMARDAGVARLAVTHFYFDVNESELKKEIESIYSGEVIIGRDGLTIEV
ncbi:MAG TPA: MBL fold metallo-hydrolase [Blastocatellia bacterium]|nr:MBL fold metallo-hydrolase [Blastocatellia bacterium]